MAPSGSMAAQDITRMASWMWSCRISSAEQSMYHFKQRMSSLEREHLQKYQFNQKAMSLKFIFSQMENSKELSNRK